MSPYLLDVRRDGRLGVKIQRLDPLDVLLLFLALRTDTEERIWTSSKHKLLLRGHPLLSLPLSMLILTLNPVQCIINKREKGLVKANPQIDGAVWRDEDVLHGQV